MPDFDITDYYKFSVYWNTGEHEVMTTPEISKFMAESGENDFHHFLRCKEKGQTYTWTDGISQEIFFTRIG